MCKESCCFQFQGCLFEGERNCLKYLKRGWNKKNLKGGRKLDQEVNALQRR